MRIAVAFIFTFVNVLAFGQNAPSTYVVKEGDTIARIALDHGISPKEFATWNCLLTGNPQSVSQIYIGQILSLQPKNNSCNQVSSGAAPTSSPPNFIWPAKGKVVQSTVGIGKGIAILGQYGDPVVAAADGTVAYAGDGLKGYGNLVLIKHDSTYLTAYANNSSLQVRTNDFVSKGQKIAEVGGSDINNPQLHFEIRVNGKPVDPEPYLKGLIASIPSAPSASSNPTPSLGDYKNKCKELGFKEQTEAFGKCVLRLSK
jgi:lipoprotein NlpD